jgi:hypothetical protein
MSTAFRETIIRADANGAAASPAAASLAAVPSAGAHVRRTAEIPVFREAAAPLKIRFLDPIREMKIGDQFRFEVAPPEKGARSRIPIEALDFRFTPFAWGDVEVGASPCVGIVRVSALHKPLDVYDRPKYEMFATFKASGGAEVETVTQFAVAVTPPVVELRFFLREAAGLTPFSPQEQARALVPERDIRVSPPDAAEVFAERERLFLRVLRPSARPRLTITFPNEEVATLEVDLDRALGVPPAGAELDAADAARAAGAHTRAGRAGAGAAAIARASALAVAAGGRRTGALLAKLGASALRGGRAIVAKRRAHRASAALARVPAQGVEAELESPA